MCETFVSYKLCHIARIKTASISNLSVSTYVETLFQSTAHFSTTTLNFAFP
eukprot:TRINITY_DN12643_c0_g1_i1.p3 TRINITY_DN12643_c0_g1~~TRINITY_DN12643_c0_g1_i1.p3  ORF type:complete len:51 (-),score=3.34 TRINITY_DN12643_c0_g1_i1:304-456(-)